MRRSQNGKLRWSGARAEKVIFLVIYGCQILPFLLATQTALATATTPQDAECQDDGTCTLPYSLDDDCQVVMAQSTLPEAGWGVFTMVDRPHRGTPLLYGDVVVQVTDMNMTYARDIAPWLVNDYFWSAEGTGGFYEGTHVLSSTPGIGTLANGVERDDSNVIPFVPMVDEAGLTRSESPGAGAITHYHNYTWFVRKPMVAGEEVFVPYGHGWFEERQQIRETDTKMHSDSEMNSNDRTRSVEWLRQNGYCLDNVKAGRSGMPNAGRGLFAARTIPKDTIVLPVPVLAIPDSRLMDFTRLSSNNKKKKINSEDKRSWKQLLLNYCFGHTNSSVLLYPYGPGASLINHGGGKYTNVRLEWEADHSPENTSLPDVHDSQLPRFLLKLVATREITPGQEILLDYQNEWIEAWVDHMQSWKPNDAYYVPSFVLDDVVKVLRTESELELHAYPDTAFTSCFYRYSDQHTRMNKATDAVVSVDWEQTRGIFELNNLRPCSVLERNENNGSFTVQMRNRPGLAQNERVSSPYIVTNVPRKAIRFSDKRYTTDQHLPGAFRHSIGMPYELWPEHWKDRKRLKELEEASAS